MIVLDQKPSWLSIILTYRGSALQRIRGRLLAVLTVATSVTFGLSHLEHASITLSLAPFSLMGLALSIFLGFRNNTSYDRFWEGRRLWGGLVNTSRTMTRRIALFVSPLDNAQDPELTKLRANLVHRTIAYIHALKMHLRGPVDCEALRPYLPDAEVNALKAHLNVPIAILTDLSSRFQEAYRAQRISEYHLPLLEESLSELTNLQGGCERIKSTPIPHSYTVLIHRIVALYCFALPFGLVGSLHGLTPIVVLIVSYAFLGLDAVGDEIEDPFGTDPNDLPLSSLSRMIEVNLRQALAETELPELLRPVDGILD